MPSSMSRSLPIYVLQHQSIPTRKNAINDITPHPELLFLPLHLRQLLSATQTQSISIRPKKKKAAISTPSQPPKTKKGLTSTASKNPHSYRHHPNSPPTNASSRPPAPAAPRSLRAPSLPTSQSAKSEGAREVSGSERSEEEQGSRENKEGATYRQRGNPQTHHLPPARRTWCVCVYMVGVKGSVDKEMMDSWMGRAGSFS